MKALQERILKDGYVLNDEILKVDAFLNHQIDAELLYEIGKEFKRRFEGVKITKIVTIEASGIAIAAVAALIFKVPVVFAKKTQSRNLDKDTYTHPVYSFTKEQTYDIHISKRYLQEEDHVLVVDDFLANGQAALGLVSLIEQSKATVAGIGIVIEKGFQPGGEKIRSLGIHVESLAIIDKIVDGKVHFAN